MLKGHKLTFIACVCVPACVCVVYLRNTYCGDEPTLLSQDDDGHDSPVVPVVETLRNIFLSVNCHVRHARQIPNNGVQLAGIAADRQGRRAGAP